MPVLYTVYSFFLGEGKGGERLFNIFSLKGGANSSTYGTQRSGFTLLPFIQVVLPLFKSYLIPLTIILQNCVKNLLILNRQGRKSSWLKSVDIPQEWAESYDCCIITKHSFMAETLETIFILPFSPRHTKLRISQDICWLLKDNEYSLHHDHIWAVLQCIE